MRYQVEYSMGTDNENPLACYTLSAIVNAETSEQAGEFLRLSVPGASVEAIEIADEEEE